MPVYKLKPVPEDLVRILGDYTGMASGVVSCFQDDSSLENIRRVFALAAQSKPPRMHTAIMWLTQRANHYHLHREEGDPRVLDSDVVNFQEVLALCSD